MVKIIVTGHGKFAEGLIDVVNFIIGKQEGLEGINYNNQDLDIYYKQIENAINNRGEEVLVFTDIIGGTPFRISSTISTKYKKVYVIAGTNIPMLIETIFKRESMSFDKLIKHIILIGKESITTVNDLLEERSASINNK